MLIKEEIKNTIKEEELDTIYLYLSYNFENMSREDQIFWTELLQTIDPEFNDTDTE